MWNVEFTDEFAEWWASLAADQQAAVEAGVRLLEQYGPLLSRPHADTTFVAFDPRRSAILLIGGDKTGDERFYERMIPLADQLFDDYLKEIQSEGLI